MFRRSELLWASDPIAAGLQIHAISCAWFLRSSSHDSTPIRCEAVLYTPAAIKILVPAASPSSVLRPSGCNLINNVGRSLVRSARSAGTSTTAFRSLPCIYHCHLSVALANALAVAKTATPEGPVSWLKDGKACARPIGKLPCVKRSSGTSWKLST